MITVFERIPDVFVERYDVAFRTWAAEFRVRGPKCAIVFERPPGAPVLLDGAGRPMMRGVWLVAEVDRTLAGEPRVVIRPADGQAEEMIERHVREMARYWLH